MKIKKTFLVMLCLLLARGPVVSAEENPAQTSQAKISQDEGGDTALVFNNADIRDVLRLIADEYDLNIVMSEEVTGAVTLRLKGTSLVNSLDAILLSRGFDYEIRDNIIRVATAEVLDQEREKRNAKQKSEPFATEVIVLRYLDANDLAPMIKSMLPATTIGRIPIPKIFNAKIDNVKATTTLPPKIQ